MDLVWVLPREVWECLRQQLWLEEYKTGRGDEPCLLLFLPTHHTSAIALLCCSDRPDGSARCGLPPLRWPGLSCRETLSLICREDSHCPYLAMLMESPWSPEAFPSFCFPSILAVLLLWAQCTSVLCCPSNQLSSSNIKSSLALH